VVAVGQSSGKLAVAPFTIAPRLYLDPKTGTVGSTITARGFGFGAAETVQVFWNNPRVLLGTVTTDSHGSFSQSTALTFTIPAGAPAGVNGIFGTGQTTGALGQGYIMVE
jgi:hypothetical protein